jgi:hypothetical protein
MATGAVIPLTLERLLEVATVGGSVRSGRTGGTAAAAGMSLPTRFREALVTTLGLNRFAPNLDVFVGAIVVALVAYGTWRLLRGDRRLLGAGLVGLATVFLALRFSGGLGFVPGFLTASPFAAVGIGFAVSPRFRFPAVVALATLPVVWLFQFTGGAGPQWGGRYELLSGALLAVVGLVAIEEHPRALVAAATCAAVVTGFGLAWLSVRSHTVAEGMQAILARHDQAVISVDAHTLREGGAFYDSSRQWLTATGTDELHRAVTIVADHGVSEFALVASAGRTFPRQIGGFTSDGLEQVRFMRSDIHLEVVTYRRG